MDSGKRIIMMVTDIRGMMLAQNIMDSGRMIKEMETQF
jgi:hypothetical protein